MTDLEKAKQINERIGLRADGRISVWCAGAWESSMLIANLQSRIEDLEHRLDKQDQSASMSQLSPQAQAVLDALCMEELNGPQQIMARAHAAAALRAAADQVVPEHAESVGDEHDDARHNQWMCIRYKFLAIADELEAQ